MLLASVLLLTAATATAMPLEQSAAEGFARLALDCVHREYPNKIAHEMNSDADAKPPRQLTPAFYGCFDWHSAVHGHWLLARFAGAFPQSKFAPAARAALERSITPAHIAVEVDYQKSRKNFERPYGLAWLLQLGIELRQSRSPLAAHLAPLEAIAVDKLKAWLPKLSHPVRTGEHSQTAFGLGLMLDWARVAGDTAFRTLLEQRVRDYYLNDRACPIHYEPGGQDFLSPCLAEADVMRRVLPAAEFTAWFRRFLPKIELEPAVVTDPTDGQLAHLDGLNLSRAWMLDGINSVLRRKDLELLAAAHLQAGIKAVSAAHYEGAHWLGTFALYAAASPR
jgi:hypothetical protein